MSFLVIHPMHLSYLNSKTTGALLLVLLCGFTLPACNSHYSDQVRQAKTLSLKGDLDEAIGALNERLEVDSELYTPDKLDDHQTLLLLERATLLQAQGKYALSARDMMIVDDKLEWLDIDKLSVKDLSTQLYSGSKANYKAPAYERLLLNTLNLINYLADDNLEDARVEARRFTVLEKFFIDDHNHTLLPGLVALGNYLSGAAYEGSRQYAEAALSYSKAWHFGLRDEELRVRLRDLYRTSNRTTAPIPDPFFEELVKEARQAGPLTRDDYFNRHQKGDTLVITQYGFAPYKKASHIPIAQARARAGIRTSTTSSNVTSIHFASLSTENLPSRSTSSPRIRIDDKNLALTHGISVTESVRQAWEVHEPKLMGAAIMRAESRAAIGEGGRTVSTTAAAANPVVGVLGWLAATSTEVALGSADLPDTRSWTTLPEYIRIARTQLPEGLHTMESYVHGSGERQLVPVWSTKLNVVNFSKVR